MKPLLALLLLPCLGVLLISLLPPRWTGTIRWLALTTAAATLAMSGWLLTLFDPAQGGIQLLEQTSWRPKTGSYFALGIDGISLPMVILATLLSFVALLASQAIKERVKGYYTLILLLETAMLGVFMAQDWSIFYIFWELTLIPLFFLINTHGGKRRNQAALNFVLYTMGGSVFMLISLLIAFDASLFHTFLMAEMATSLRTLSKESQIIIFLGFLIGFGVKMPIFPLHGWLPLAHVEAPSPVSILLSGALLKMGAYGLIRAASMLPDAVVALQSFLATLAMINLLYGGILAWRQSNIKAMIAYSSVSHMGVVLLGIATLNQAGITGAVMQMIAHGLTAAALFLVIGLLYQRTYTTDINHYGSLTRITPRFSFFIALAFFASVGVPGVVGFIAEIHVIVGTFQRWGWFAALLSVSMLVSAAYAIRTIGRLCTGPEQETMAQPSDMKPMEIMAAGILASAILLLGLLPAPALRLMNTSLGHFSSLFASRL